MNTKSIMPSAEHLRFRKALEKTIADHGATLDSSEICAILSHMVGQVIALLDQRKYTPEMAMEVVTRNISLGNQSVIEGLLNSPNGVPQ